MRILTLVLIASIVPCRLDARIHSCIGLQDSLFAFLPRPAANATEAIRRCPADEDTAITAFLARMDTASRVSTAEADTLTILFNQTEHKCFERIRTGMYEQMRVIGEQLDSAIRSCPKQHDRFGRLVYDSLCVVLAEQKNHRDRVEAVDHFLTAAQNIWPTFLEQMHAHLQASHDLERLLAIRVARAAAAITRTAAQFAR